MSVCVSERALLAGRRRARSVRFLGHVAREVQRRVVVLAHTGIQLYTKYDLLNTCIKERCNIL